MKIGIDISPMHNEYAGIGHFTETLTQELLKLDKHNRYFLYHHTKPQNFALSKNAHFVILKFPKILPFKGVRWINKVSSDAKQKNLDLFISFSNHLFSLTFPKTFQFIHDLSPVKFPQYYSAKTVSLYNFTTKIAANRAVKILTISETVKSELHEFTNIDLDRIEVIYPGLSNFLAIQQRSNSAKEIIEKYHLPSHYMLSVSTLEPKKNTVSLIKAYAQFKKNNLSDFKLVIVGKKGWHYQEIFNLVKKLNLDNEVLFLGYVPDSELAVVYQKAKLYVNLSLYEGFGITPLEALYFNLPTVLSDIPVFKECYNGLVEFVKPKYIEQIANTLKILSENPKLKNTKKQVINLYSWQKSAQKLLKLINSYASERKN